MDSATKVFGTRPDGTLVVCRALPENRGKRNCPHAEDHIELSIKQLRSGFLIRHNEEALAKFFGEFPELTRSSASQKAKERRDARFIETDPEIMELKGKARRMDMIARGKENVKNFTQEQYDFSKGFYSHIKDMLPTQDGPIERNKSKVNELSTFLKSGSVFAVEAREFFGDDINLDDLSDVLVNTPKSMSSHIPWRRSHNSCKRAVLTSLNNDMSKENYVTSVVFFKGKCCYCNCNLKKMRTRNQMQQANT